LISQEITMRHSCFSFIAAAMLTAATSVAFAQTGSSPSKSTVTGEQMPPSDNGYRVKGKPHEKKTPSIDISNQSGTASGSRGSSGVRGSEADSSVTGRSRSPDTNYGSNDASKAATIGRRGAGAGDTSNSGQAEADKSRTNQH
jgi:hypothetical protein